MELEIERKWLVPTDMWEVAKAHTKGMDWIEIEQGYISPEVRIRKTVNGKETAIICVKQRETLLTVKEYNYEIPISDADMMLAKLSVIKKSRHNTDTDGYTLDYFLGALEGLVLVEKEFESEEAAANEELPGWLEDCPEVTGDPAYINANLGTAMFIKGVGLVDSENLLTGDEEVIDHDGEWEAADLEESRNI